MLLLYDSLVNTFYFHKVFIHIYILMYLLKLNTLIFLLHWIKYMNISRLITISKVLNLLKNCIEKYLISYS